MKDGSDEMHYELANTLDLLMVEMMEFIHSNCFFDGKSFYCNHFKS